MSSAHGDASAHRIDPKDLRGLSYDPNEVKFWDREALQHELERVFDICHGCRMCFSFCPTFPMLFELVDRNDGDVTKLTPSEVDATAATCYQCKLCYVKCPYTPDDKHEWQLDFPRLLMRKKAQDAKRDGVALRERVLGNPTLTGELAKVNPTIANWANRPRFHRVIMEKVLGIHRDKLLPDFVGETFEEWFRNHRHELGVDDGTNGSVALFETCFVNYNNPEVGKAAVDVLARNKVRVSCPKQNCCGMPALDGGDVEFAKQQAQANVDSLLPEVRKGKKVLAINPTCSLTLKKEYPTLLGTPEAKELSEAVMDVYEFLFTLKRAGTFDRGFQSTPGKVAYHVPCHLRAQNIGYRSRDMMKTIPEAAVEPVAECCGHDGTWAMKTEFFEMSIKAGQKAFDGVKQATGDVTTTDCPLAAIQFEQATGQRPIHPLQVLSKAYKAPGQGGFATPVPTPEETE
jgi:glycerol-3-phosphate dehydrogenase subunit C